MQSTLDELKAIDRKIQVRLDIKSLVISVSYLLHLQ